MYSNNLINKYNKLIPSPQDQDLFIVSIKHIINDLYEAKQYSTNNEELHKVIDAVNRATETVRMLIQTIEASNLENMEPMIYVFHQLMLNLNFLVVKSAKPNDYDYIIEYFEKIKHNMALILNEKLNNSYDNTTKINTPAALYDSSDLKNSVNEHDDKLKENSLKETTTKFKVTI